ncbi:hypothetical protein BOX15_Mlig007253g2 [Macrostomum lignano]|uniref:Uncharacterized protein n=1 Tax=Macrostomum lignano TaxID=282301 RepID=A0A267GER4_9PLAT|nr:hypothetical protein BOX15_Mlig007253g1 [Macrostomum lignano]PAA83927.1 hypothetical protein BOX15_Mlig007253g2 [Macrostomum lignano]
MFSIVSRRSSRPSCAVSIACAAAFVLLLTLVACGQPADSASVNRAENPYMAAMFAKARPNCSFNQFMDSMAVRCRRHSDCCQPNICIMKRGAKTGHCCCSFPGEK